MPRSVDPSVIRKGSGLQNQDSIDANAFVDEVDEGLLSMLNAHANDQKGAHPATAISTTGSGNQFFTLTTQGNLDELATLVPPKPPTLGTTSIGIPDWGILKLRDAGFVRRGDVPASDPLDPPHDGYVYSEFWYPPYEAANLVGTNPPGDAFTVPGDDPATDPMFNLDPAGTGDPTYTGGGVGTTHQGGFTRVIVGPTVIETARVTFVGPGDFVVVSGVLFPADRGVVALFHWPAGGDVAAFLAQPLDERVLAAIRCGQGFGGSCDGDPGGIFTEGGGMADFPGRYTGQYDLSELHLGIDAQTGLPLPGGPDPGAGQVRLGIDPNAGPLIPGGIKILGGSTAANGGGNDNNFFRYRLPYLADYSDLPLVHTTQKPRWFQKPVVSQDFAVDLTLAGNYTGFTKDYAAFQVARYRHRFQLQSPPVDQGSYFFLHFKKEVDFELFARDGVMPDDALQGYPLWSAGLVNYTNPESTDNLVDTTDPIRPLTAPSYHVLRSAVFEDANAAPISVITTYTYQRVVDEVMFASGVQYFLPNALGPGDNWGIPSLTLQIAALWDNAYLMGNHGTALEETPGLWHRPPVHLYLGVGTSGSNILNGSGPGYTGVAGYQRVDFDYFDLGILSGPFSLTNAPVPGQTADIDLTLADGPIQFAGDDAPCHFWHGLNLRAFARKPLGGQDPLAATVEFTFPTPDGKQILIHTTSHSPSFTSTGSYGNFVVPPLNVPRPGLENARKDVEERFLDEVYRISSMDFPLVDPTWDGTVGNLVGPGLPFPGGPMDFPVRIATSPTFFTASFLRSLYHLADLSLAAPAFQEAQVAGLPDRSPPIVSGAVNPGPFAGRLIFPTTNYTVGYRPSLADADTTVAQFDYSVITNDRQYLRVLDAAYFNDVVPEPTVVGQATLYVRVDGLELLDFAYNPPGPGNGNIAILIKIPGQTTWMDIGRADGDGPSKQDALADGAGCQVVGPDTFDGLDAQSGVAYAQVRVHVGPIATVFANTTLGAPEDGIAPILVKVIVPRTSTLDFTQGGPNGLARGARALVGLTILRYSNQEGPPPFALPPFP